MTPISENHRHLLQKASRLQGIFPEEFRGFCGSLRDQPSLPGYSYFLVDIKFAFEQFFDDPSRLPSSPLGSV